MIQIRVANQLLQLLAEHCTTPINRVLEIGCCTGLLTRRLADEYPDIIEIVLNDLVAGFADRAGDVPGIAQVSFLAGDIETIALPGSFDLIISSSTFHWIHDLDNMLAKLATHLKPGAPLAFSMYGPGNLEEIREITGIGLPYSSLQQVAEMVSRHFTLDHCSESLECFWFENPGKVLDHLRQTGVNALGDGPWTPRRLQRFNEEYLQRFSEPQGVHLSYHPLYLLAHR